jgi:hypothetical protein
MTGAGAIGLALMLAAGCSKPAAEPPPQPPMTEILSSDPAGETMVAKAEAARKKEVAEAFDKEMAGFIATGRTFNKFLEGAPATDQYATQLEAVHKSWEAITFDPDEPWQSATKELADRVVEAIDGEQGFAQMNDDAAALGTLGGDKELSKIKAQERKEHVAEQSKRIARLLDELERCVKEKASPKEDIN